MTLSGGVEWAFGFKKLACRAAVKAGNTHVGHQHMDVELWGGISEGLALGFRVVGGI